MATIRLSVRSRAARLGGPPLGLCPGDRPCRWAPAAGDVVRVVDPHGKLLGKGYWSPKSAIPIRILTRAEDDPLDAASLGRRIETAATVRRSLFGLPDDATDAYRLVHAEGDDLAGLIVDVYRDIATVQLLTAGMKQRQEEVFGHVARVTGARTVIEIASPRIQRLEGIECETRVARGPDVDALRFRERGFDIEVDIAMAQKTGYYLDQRDNRAVVERLARGRRVLDAFCYVGAFALAAARGGAEHVVSLDSSAPALAAAAALARRHGYAGASTRSTRTHARRWGKWPDAARPSTW